MSAPPPPKKMHNKLRKAMVKAPKRQPSPILSRSPSPDPEEEVEPSTPAGEPATTSTPAGETATTTTEASPPSPIPTTSMGDDTYQEVVFNLGDNEVEVLEEELAEVEEEEQDSQPSKKRKRKATQVILAEETERLLGEWLEFDVPYFYNRGLPDYKNKAKQQAVLEEKGKSLDPPLTAVQLEQWLTTIRTRFGRLSKEKSGQGAVRLTDREKWILRTFHFLKPHITRQRKPRTLGLSQSAASAAAPPDGNPRGPPEPSSGNESGTQEDPEVEEVTPAINLPRRKKLKTGSGIEKLIQDAAACRDTLREAVDVIHSNPEVEHWKALFDSHAQDAALIQGDLGLLLKMEIASLIRRFSAVQRSGREVNEAELLLHTRENINRLVAPPQPTPQPTPIPAAPALVPHQLPLLPQTLPPSVGPIQPQGPTTMTANQYATLTEALRPICSTPAANISLSDTSFLQGFFSQSQTPGPTPSTSSNTNQHTNN